MFKENTYENSAEKGGQFRYTSRMTKIELKGNFRLTCHTEWAMGRREPTAGSISSFFPMAVFMSLNKPTIMTIIMSSTTGFMHRARRQGLNLSLYRQTFYFTITSKYRALIKQRTWFKRNTDECAIKDQHMLNELSSKQDFSAQLTCLSK